MLTREPTIRPVVTFFLRAFSDFEKTGEAIQKLLLRHESQKKTVGADDTELYEFST